MVPVMGAVWAPFEVLSYTLFPPTYAYRTPPTPPFEFLPTSVAVPAARSAVQLARSERFVHYFSSSWSTFRAHLHRAHLALIIVITVVVDVPHSAHL